MQPNNITIYIRILSSKLSLILFALTALSFQSQKQSAIPKYFVGYSGLNPIFDSPKEKTLYKFRNGATEVFCKYSSNRIVLMTTDTVLIFYEKTNNGNKLIVKSGNTEKEHLLRTSLSFLTAGKGDIFYTDLRDDNSINRIQNNKNIIKTGISGQVITLINNNLYFSKIHDSLEVAANADIFKVDVSSMEHIEKVVSNVSGESTYIFPGEEYIYETILHEGAFRPSIYSIKEKKYCLLEGIDKRFINNTPYYSYKNNCLAFYDKNSLEIKYIEIPKVFNISR